MLVARISTYDGHVEDIGGVLKDGLRTEWECRKHLFAKLGWFLVFNDLGNVV